MKRLIASWIVMALALPCRAEEPNCFAPFLNDDSPEVVEVLSRGQEQGVEVTRLKFLSRVVPDSGAKVIIYAIMAKPTTPGPHPGVLVCHGGGGYADMVGQAVIGWAKRGYVSVCQDQPGICNRAKARSTGPCMEPGAPLLGISDDPTESALYDGVAAALNGLRLLRSQPEVDRQRIGVFGGSWGGYMTTMVSGISGDRVHAAFSVYGCGYFDVGSNWAHALRTMQPGPRETWLKHLDAGRRAKNLSAAYFVPSPSNDWYFWPSAVMRTLADMPGEKNYCFMPNDSHSLRQPGGMSGPPKVNHAENRTYMEIVWMDYHLRGAGLPFPRCAVEGEPRRDGNTIRVRFRVQKPMPLKQSRVCYAAGELAWRMKWWSSAPAEPCEDDNAAYEARIPVDEPGEPIHWFGLVSDEQNRSVSTLVKTLDPQQCGFRVDGYPVNTFSEGFEDRVEWFRWRRSYANRQPGRMAITPEAARSGQFGLRLSGETTVACWGVRAATLRRSKATAIRLWIRAVDKPCEMPAVELQAELPDGERLRWRCTGRPGEPLPTDWRMVELRLEDFEYLGSGEPPVALLSPALGQLRFLTTESTDVHIDDIDAR